MDLTQFSSHQLNDILARIPDELARRENIIHRRIRSELEELAARHGHSLDRLLDEAADQFRRLALRGR